VEFLAGTSRAAPKIPPDGTDALWGEVILSYLDRATEADQLRRWLEVTSVRNGGGRNGAGRFLARDVPVREGRDLPVATAWDASGGAGTAVGTAVGMVFVDGTPPRLSVEPTRPAPWYARRW